MLKKIEDVTERIFLYTAEAAAGIVASWAFMGFFTNINREILNTFYSTLFNIDVFIGVLASIINTNLRILNKRKAKQKNGSKYI